MTGSNPHSYVDKGYNSEDLGKKPPHKSGKAAVEDGEDACTVLFTGISIVTASFYKISI